MNRGTTFLFRAEIKKYFCSVFGPETDPETGN